MFKYTPLIILALAGSISAMTENDQKPQTPINLFNFCSIFRQTYTTAPGLFKTSLWGASQSTQLNELCTEMKKFQDCAAIRGSDIKKNSQCHGYITDLHPSTIRAANEGSYGSINLVYDSLRFLSVMREITDIINESGAAQKIVPDYTDVTVDHLQSFRKSWWRL